jgi:hypothetical protein
MTTTEMQMENKHVVLHINVMEQADNKFKKIHTYIHIYTYIQM